MKIGLTLLCKDEIDIIKWWIGSHVSDRFDEIIIMDNGSTDGTLEVLQKLGSKITLLQQPNQEYWQAQWVYEMDMMLKIRGCEWAANVDADEFLTGDVRAACERAETAGCCQLYAIGMFMRPTVRDPVEGDPLGRIRYHDPEDVKYSNDKAIVLLEGLVEICQGCHWGYWNHPVRSIYDDHLGLPHYEQRSPEQFCKKYRGVWSEEKLKNMGEGWRTMNRLWLEGGDEALMQHYKEHIVATEQDIIDKRLTNK